MEDSDINQLMNIFFNHFDYKNVVLHNQNNHDKVAVIKNIMINLGND